MRFAVSLAVLAAQQLWIANAERGLGAIIESVFAPRSSRLLHERQKIAVRHRSRKKFEVGMGERRWIDPTAASIERGNAEREELRDEVTRLERALAQAYTDNQVLTADRDGLRAASQSVEETKAELFRLRKIADDAERAEDKGYDQAVRDIRDHFKRQKDLEVVRTIESLWLKERA